jgi:hypothetical protein
MAVLQAIPTAVSVSTSGATYSLKTDEMYSLYHFTGSGTLSGNINITSTGALIEGLTFDILLDLSIVLSTFNITVFGQQLTQTQTRGTSLIRCYYNGSAWVVTILTEPFVKNYEAVNVRNDSPAFGSYTLTSGRDKNTQVVEGTFTLGADYQFTLSGTAVDGDSFRMLWNASCTRSGHNVTIFGINCNQFVDNGQFQVVAFYSGSAWKASVILGSGNNISEIWATGAGANSIYRKGYSTSANTTGAGAINLGDSTTVVSGNDAYSDGTNNTSSGLNSSTSGGSNTASGQYAQARGRQNTATGTYSIANGGFNSSSGQGSVAEGDSNTASADYSIATGTLAQSRRKGQRSHSAGAVTSYYSQGTELFARCSTTNGTSTTMFLDGVSSRITIPANTAVRLGARIIAVQEGGSSGTIGDMATWDILCTIKNVAGTTSIVDNILYLDNAGAYQTTHHQSSQDLGANAWVIAVSADNTNDALNIQVTGEANKNVAWHGVIYMNEIKFGA